MSNPCSLCDRTFPTRSARDVHRRKCPHRVVVSGRYISQTASELLLQVAPSSVVVRSAPILENVNDDNGEATGDGLHVSNQISGTSDTSLATPEVNNVSLSFPCLERRTKY